MSPEVLVIGLDAAEGNPPRQIHSVQTALRKLEPEDIAGFPPYWRYVSDAGRVAVVDQPQTILAQGLNGLLLTEWGLHDRNFVIAKRAAGHPRRGP
jgi:hypothetical protein